VAIPPDAMSPLKIALEQYGAALQYDPGDADAALHFGRVSLLLAHDAEAAPRLRAAAQAHSRLVRYLAQMFLGAAAERAGRIDDAIDRYRQAQAAYRWGQSAPLAVSEALMRAGKDDDARAALLDRFTAPDRRAFDPLWTYLADPSTDLGPTLDALRAEVWR
jgi:tetratricopeptide (TPR) repeat protein